MVGEEVISGRLIGGTAHGMTERADTTAHLQ